MEENTKAVERNAVKRRRSKRLSALDPQPTQNGGLREKFDQARLGVRARNSILGVDLLKDIKDVVGRKCERFQCVCLSQGR